MNVIKSEVIGELTQNDRFEDWWETNDIFFPILESEMTVIFMDFEPEKDTQFIKEADESLKNFMQLKPDYKEEIAKYIYANFIDFCSMVSEIDIPNHMKNIQESEIWNFVYPTCLYVTRRPYGDEEIYLNLACSCDWEKEHGLQLVFKKGKKLTRVSDQDGSLTDADACGIPDSEDKLLSAFDD